MERKHIGPVETIDIAPILGYTNSLLLVIDLLLFNNQYFGAGTLLAGATILANAYIIYRATQNLPSPDVTLSWQP